MVDAVFGDPRLAALYDPLDPDRSDLDVYVAMVDEFSARRVIDIGCGTGTLACLLAAGGVDVVAVDPAEASLDVARRKPGAERVRWVLGDATTLPPVQVDLVTMTGNVAQVFLTDHEWASNLEAARAALRPGGRLVLETRDPAAEAWRGWNRDATRARTAIDGVGVVETWVDVVAVDHPLVSFRWSFRFEDDGRVLTSDSTLRFRSCEEVDRSLTAAGFQLDEVRDARDRPGLELVFLARRPA